jgi:HAD superfamily hydrolase (TIGR01493 family)
MKKVISFDLDGTIVDAAYGNMVWLEGIPEKYGRRHSLSMDDAKRIVKEQYDSVGEASLLWYDMTYWIKRFDLTFSIPELLDFYGDYIQLLPNVREVILELSSRYMLVIASNAARIFVEKELAHTGLGPYFDHAFSATSDFGMVKKEEAFFRTLCDRLAVSPDEVVHVGDHAVFDYEVPRGLGIDAYHYAPGGKLNGRTIGDFKELLDRL